MQGRLKKRQLVHLPMPFRLVADGAIGIAEVQRHLAIGGVESGEVGIVRAVVFGEQRHDRLRSSLVVRPHPCPNEGRVLDRGIGATLVLRPGIGAIGEDHLAVLRHPEAELVRLLVGLPLRLVVPEGIGIATGRQAIPEIRLDRDGLETVRRVLHPIGAGEHVERHVEILEQVAPEDRRLLVLQPELGRLLAAEEKGVVAHAGLGALADVLAAGVVRGNIARRRHRTGLRQRGGEIGGVLVDVEGRLGQGNAGRRSEQGERPDHEAAPQPARQHRSEDPVLPDTRVIDQRSRSMGEEERQQGVGRHLLPAVDPHRELTIIVDEHRQLRDTENVDVDRLGVLIEPAEQRNDDEQGVDSQMRRLRAETQEEGLGG